MTADSSPGLGLLTTDAGLAIQSWNLWLATASGRSEDAVLGCSLPDLTPERSRQALTEVFSEVLKTGTTRVLAPALHHFLIRCDPQTPSPFFAEMQQYVTIAPLRDGQTIAGLIITIEDVTERRDRERALASQLATNPAAIDAATLIEGVGAGDWRIRAEAVRTLSDRAGAQEIAELMRSLERRHLDLNVLSSALRVLVTTRHDVVVPFAALLTDENPNLRMHAAQALGLIEHPEAVPHLVRALGDPDANVRFHALEALGRLRAPEAVDALLDVAHSGDFFLAFPAIDALAKIDDPFIVAGLVELLEQEMLRPAVVDALGDMGDEECVAPLMQGLNDEMLEAPAVAAALCAIHDRYEEDDDAGSHIRDCASAAAASSGIRRLEDALERRQTPKAPIVRVLGWMGSQGLPTLVGLMGDPEVDDEVAMAIEAIGTPAVVPVMTVLRQGSREARLSAAAVLGRLGDRQATPALIQALGQGDAELAVAASSSVASLGDDRAIESLFDLFSDVQAPVRRAAVAAVNAIGAPGTETLVRASLTHAEALVRESAVRVMDYVGVDASAEVLLRAAEDGDEAVRRAAIEQLPYCEDDRACDTLVAALHAETPRNRAAAAHALKFVQQGDVELPLVAALRDADPWVRYFAADALAVHGHGVAADALVHLAEHEPATQVRIAALRSLGARHPTASVPLGTRFAASDDDDLACTAIALLTAATDAAVDSQLAEIARGPRQALRLAAVTVLGARATKQSVAFLAEVARLPVDPPPGSAAIEALGRAALTSNHEVAGLAVETLLTLGSDAQWHDQVVKTIAALPSDVCHWLEPALASAQVNTRRLVIDCLARLRHPSGSDLIVVALTDEDPSVRAHALNAIARLGPLAAAPRTAAVAASDPDDGVRRRALAACRRHGWEPASERTDR